MDINKRIKIKLWQPIITKNLIKKYRVDISETEEEFLEKRNKKREYINEYLKTYEPPKRPKVPYFKVRLEDINKPKIKKKRRKRRKKKKFNFNLLKKYIKDKKIYIFRDKKRYKLLYKTNTVKDVYDKFNEIVANNKPRFTEKFYPHTNKFADFEIGVLIPKKNKEEEGQIHYYRDKLGRNRQFVYPGNYNLTKLENYYPEGYIYDFYAKKRVTYLEFLKRLYEIKEIAQVIKIGRCIVLLSENNMLIFYTYNNYNTNRLFDVMVTDLLSFEVTNMLFSKVISKEQSKEFYDIIFERDNTLNKNMFDKI